MNLTKRLKRLYTGAVHDVLRELGQKNFVLPSNITPLDPSQKLAGEIYTVEGGLKDNLDNHDSLLKWTELLSRAPSNTVLCCQPNTCEVALMGELSAETLQKKNVLGYVVDGACRDTEFILKIKFSVFRRFNTPVDVVGRWIPSSFGEPIRIGNVDIESGDYMLADRDGIIVIPKSLAEETILKTEEITSTEDKVRTSILQGIDPREAYLRYKKF